MRTDKVRIFLADLTHTEVCIVSETIPLNVGMIASYAKQEFGDQVEISLFKFPDRFLEALERDKPDIVGVSNYAWNSRLAEWACRKAKERNPDVLTVKGGWNFPLDHPEDRLTFMSECPA
ncbi:MAG: cobalamin-dependent protein, partial [Deltaproteobacteria bacterium]|nr:cobalamin-dependent protein [Deltaproteobacteria bacterium]